MVAVSPDDEVDRAVELMRERAVRRLRSSRRTGRWAPFR
ncbi:hypothetical protein [Streptomyces flaveus]